VKFNIQNFIFVKSSEAIGGDCIPFQEKWKYIFETIFKATSDQIKNCQMGIWIGSC